MCCKDMQQHAAQAAIKPLLLLPNSMSWASFVDNAGNSILRLTGIHQGRPQLVCPSRRQGSQKGRVALANSMSATGKGSTCGSVWLAAGGAISEETSSNAHPLVELTALCRHVIV